MRNGGFLAHRNPQESEDEPEILRPYRQATSEVAPIHVPRVPDGVLWRVLEKLLMLDAERLSYRALDVEQIGSVYEAIAVCTGLSSDEVLGRACDDCGEGATGRSSTGSSTSPSTAAPT